MILKLLLIIGIMVAVYYIFIKKQVPKDSETDKKKFEASDMIECAKCGVYCEINEAILSRGKYYCSKKCVDNI